MEKVTKWLKERKRLLTSKNGEVIAMWRARSSVEAKGVRTSRSGSVPTPNIQCASSPPSGRLIKAASLPPNAPKKLAKGLAQSEIQGNCRAASSEFVTDGEDLSRKIGLLSSHSTEQDSVVTVEDKLEVGSSFFASTSSDEDIITSKIGNFLFCISMMTLNFLRS